MRGAHDPNRNVVITHRDGPVVQPVAALPAERTPEPAGDILHDEAHLKEASIEQWSGLTRRTMIFGLSVGAWGIVIAAIVRLM